MRRSWYLALQAFFLLALVGSAIGLLYSGGREGWFLTHATRVQGNVVSVQSIYHSGTGTHPNSYTDYLPTITFQDAGGKAWTFTPEDSGYEGKRVGVVLPVLYDPANPVNAQIASWHGEWSGTVGFIYLGLFASVALVASRQLATPARPAPLSDSTIPAGP